MTTCTCRQHLYTAFMGGAFSLTYFFAGCNICTILYSIAFSFPNANDPCIMMHKSLSCLSLLFFMFFFLDMKSIKR